MTERLTTLKIPIEGDAYVSEFPIVRTRQDQFMLKTREDYFELLSSLGHWLDSNPRLSSRDYMRSIQDQLIKGCEDCISNLEIDSIKPFDHSETMNLIDAEQGGSGAEQTFIKECKLMIESYVDDRVDQLKGLFESNNEQQKGLKFEHVQTYKIPCLNKIFKLKYEKTEDYLTTSGLKRLLYESGELFYDGQIKDNMIYGNDILLYHKNGEVLLQVKSEEENYLDKTKGDIMSFYSNKELQFGGLLVDGLKNGIGGEGYDNSVIRYEGQYQNGGIHGDSVYICDSNGKVIIENECFVEGKLCDGYMRNNLKCISNHYSEGFQWKDGKLDNSKEGSGLCKLATPNGRYLIQGNFKDGKLNGDGKFSVQTSNSIIFDGEWKNGLPYKNKNYEGELLTFKDPYTQRESFVGKIKRGNGGWIFGEGSFYQYSDSSKVQYKGKFRCPTIYSLMLMTPDIELLDYKDILPKLHDQNNDEYTA